MFRRVTFLCLLASVAQAQTYKSVNIPLCFPPLTPPGQTFRIYQDGVKVLEKPLWVPNGSARTSVFAHCARGSKLAFTVVQNGKETPQTTTVYQAEAPAGTPCWQAAPSSGGPLLCDELRGPSDWLADLAKDCLSDPACGQFVMQTCEKDPACAAALSVHTHVDYDQDGVTGPGDQAWLGYALDGVVK